MIDTRAPALVPATSAPLVEAIVDLSAIAYNVSLVHSVARTPMMAVVKADGFGLGANDVARAVLSAGAEWLGVATIEEALALRRAGITAPVLAWLVDAHSAIDDAVRADVTVSCSDVSTLEAVADAAWRAGRRAKVHLELDTGMRRGGTSRSEWRTLFRTAGSPEVLRFIDVDGIWSHLASASDPERSAVADQHAAFIEGTRIARSLGVRPRILHLANSAAALVHPECRFSLVRIGAALYGIETVDGISVGLPVAPSADLPRAARPARSCRLRSRLRRRPPNHSEYDAGARAGRIRRRSPTGADRRRLRVDRRQAPSDRRVDLHGSARGGCR